MKLKRSRGAVVLSTLAVVLSLSLALSLSGVKADSAPTSESQIPSGRFVGNIVETMDAGAYTYVLLERAGEQIWAAGPQAVVGIGDELTVGLDMRMDDFVSDKLERTFEQVYFVGSLGVAEAPTGHGASPKASTPETSQVDPASIEMPEGGHRINDVWAHRQDLMGQEVTIRGHVTKYNAGILGRNWLHLQDGSGDAAKGDHDLTVTTDGTATVGEIVTVRGTVALDQDFGAGYVYELLVEKAVVETQASR